MMFSRRLSREKNEAPVHTIADVRLLPSEQADLMLCTGFTNREFPKPTEASRKSPVVSEKRFTESTQTASILHILHVHLDARKRGTAYEVAEKLGLQSDMPKHEMLHMFLRANNFEPKATANQIISFYEMKLWLFGKEKLTKEITVDDLNEDDWESLQSGSMQLVSSDGSDLQSRRILMCLPGRRVFGSIENELRSRFYMVMSALKLPEVQKDGLAVVFHSIGKYKDRSNGSGYAENSRLLSSLPVKISSIHLCVDDYAQFVVGSAAFSTHLSPSLSARVKIHTGSEMDCLFGLSKFGISSGSLPPVDGSDRPWMEAHLAWCNSRGIFSASPPKKPQPKYSLGFHGQPDGISEPQELDVLFGADQHKSHPGNIKFHMLIDNLQHQYEDADKDGKVMVSLIAVFSMKGTGSRFLNYDVVTQQWHQLPDTRARNKVTKIIRNRRRYKKRS